MSCPENSSDSDDDVPTVEGLMDDIGEDIDLLISLLERDEQQNSEILQHIQRCQRSLITSSSIYATTPR